VQIVKAETFQLGIAARCLGGFSFSIMGRCVIPTVRPIIDVLQWAMIRAVIRWYALGYSAIVVASFIFIVVGHSTLWNQVAGTVVR
jgi:hypothetical protein